jgi:hypothetical protein
VAVDSQSRNSIAASESNPSSVNVTLESTASGEECPRTAAACVRTSSSHTCSRSASLTPARRIASDAFAVSEPPRLLARTSEDSTAGSTPALASRCNAALSKRTVTAVARFWATARSKSCSPSSIESVRMLAEPTARRTSTSSTKRPIPVPPQSPHAIEVATSPREWRCSARASRNALAAA